MMSAPTPESLKEKAKVIRKFINEKYPVDVSHGHCMELVSIAFGFKDWNTAKAALSKSTSVKGLVKARTPESEISSPSQGMTAGDIRKALEGYDDSATIDADFEFNLKDFVDNLDPDVTNPKASIYQEFAISAVDRVDDDYATLKLKLVEESYQDMF